MGHRLNRLDEPIFIAVSKPLLTEFGIHHRDWKIVYPLFIEGFEFGTNETLTKNGSPGIFGIV